AGSATVDLPALSPKINFYPHRNHSFFRMVVVLGLMPGIYFTKNGFAAAMQPKDYPRVQIQTDWYFVNKGCPAQRVELQLPSLPPGDHALILSAGLCFGSVQEGGVMTQEKYSGVAKVLAVG
ncbi:MAG TPA: hypothetical protein VF145_10430, partial [Chitinophagaceae bacterium]